MDIVLTPEMEAAIQQKVKSGEYESPSALVTEALRRLLDERNELDESEELRGEIQIGLDQFERGEYRVYDRASLPLLAEEIKERGRRQLAAQREQASE